VRHARRGCVVGRRHLLGNTGAGLRRIVDPAPNAAAISGNSGGSA